MEKIAIFSGSFDPITNGHLDILKRGLSLFDKIIVVVSTNEQKTYTFSSKERITLVKQVCQSLDNVYVIGHTKGLLIDVAKHYQAIAILRGVRQTADLLYEQTMSCYNQDIETVILLTKPEYSHISSSGVKTFYKLGGDIKAMVPPVVHHALRERLLIETLEMTE
ncbi:pantetheine-phosphate adenylyltransferase [Granulicatella sp. zg-ZJ]|uniref:pantetheine-phosphate adenylyltransferase n=1 Tax=unclassified Granulicatella TaxID=2630493 RepID=UPI0013C0F36F|nr:MULTISPECIES: pantetheine-phosphate adenylyltransferase [unclassified Granulicatella]NEW62403.1 pantetheine-phosphate adenylyltransferase [Granulicatella sp. zg-ZJ]NEW66348.1 pantetheine-phosphate adenylyltransferase [Granulicatella sp. zg-84]QMI86477.1 pantetheine-phosphate adenylyltransferase [Carnobacteriaceae bacterium zg-84]